jgi:hypothetical protein
MRLASACDVLRGIVSPCRWREFVESAATENVVEAAQVNIKRSFQRCPSGLHNASCELICGKLEDAVTNPHLIVLTAAWAVLKARRVSPGRDPVSEGHQHCSLRVPSYIPRHPYCSYRASHLELQTAHRQPTNEPRCKEESYKKIVPFCLVAESVEAES